MELVHFGVQRRLPRRQLVGFCNQVAVVTQPLDGRVSFGDNCNIVRGSVNHVLCKTAVLGIRGLFPESSYGTHASPQSEPIRVKQIPFIYSGIYDAPPFCIFVLR